jgi:L-iditol 2-dehydrogenase
MECVYCRSGHFNVCPDVPFFGTPPTDGCFRDFVTWPTSLVLMIPDNVSFDEAAMAEPLAIGLYAIELAKPRLGETAVILGAGAVGLSVLKAARLLAIP